MVQQQKAFASAIERVFKKTRYGIASVHSDNYLDLAIMRKYIVDWQVNEDADALTTTSVQYTTWLPVLYDVNTSGNLGSSVSSVSSSPSALSFGYSHPGGNQNIIDINTGGCLTRINLNPTINIDNSTGSSTVSYVHTQSTAATTWTITHNLGFIPNVFIIDGQGVELIGSINSVSNTSISISFSQPVTGTAYLT